MKKHRVSLVGVAFAVLLVLVVAFLLRVSLHRSPEVTLPETDTSESGGGVASGAGREAIRRVEVTPQTVQRVIERLARPANYSRTITLERYWPDSGGQAAAEVRAADGWTRIDVYAENEEQRHIITGGGRSWIWYGAGEPVFSGAAALTADEEQGIPSYEDILLLDTDDIAVADYRAFDAVNCIFVETAADPSGYVDRWWVSVDSGLLIAAERLGAADVVYRMTGLGVETGVVTDDAFRLPDGETLYVPKGENEGA